MSRQPEQNVTTRDWFAGLVCLALLPLTLPVLSQEGENTSAAGDAPQAVVDFHKRFLSLYMENYERIQDLESMRSAGANDRAGDLKAKIRSSTEDALSNIHDKFRSARQDESARPFLVSMKKALRIYPVYIDKIVNGWEPSREQVIKRRRLNDAEILRRNPEIANTSLLRRAFLGELLSNTQSIPQLGDWFNKRISRVNDWISEKYNALFPLFDRLLSRVQRVFNNDEAGEAKRKQVRTDVRNEWNDFWKDAGNTTEWSNIRDTLSRLRSLFRDRSNRLPGNQDRLKEQVAQLQQQIGKLQQLHVEQPFSNQEQRLRLMLRISKAFVKRAGYIGTGGSADLISGMAKQFLSRFINRSPEEYWNADNGEELTGKKTSVLEDLDAQFQTLGLMNYTSTREQYKFPFDTVLNLSSRLGTNYGAEEQNIARHVRDVAHFVQSRYYLSNEGLKLMEAYRNGLREVDADRPNEFVKFEVAFRKEYETELRQVQGHINRIEELRERMDTIEREMENVDPDELAATFFNGSTSDNR